ncbi:TPA: VOC family protein [Stenotrophomonas maltophilia]|uniref:bleomycin resistance protein n=1 Tax=Stenotrophomonas maltophilia group TaxID=995085 RepID=UPI0015DEB12E|nr:VOC family protein [Stenotrophomonas maltophilia]MDZ5816298.1 VOC family protein [Stenotrophomonas maltophilia]HEL3814630.1 VOC family protein [Stenotrophomonas maltophilia]
MKIESISPILSVDHLAESIAFYCGTLGFELAWSWGDPTDIAAVCRDGVEITLTQRSGSKPAGAAHAYLVVSGIDDYYRTLEGSGVTIVVPIGDRPYGMRDFRLADPSGNELSIGQVIENRDSAR